MEKVIVLFVVVLIAVAFALYVGKRSAAHGSPAHASARASASR